MCGLKDRENHQSKGEYEKGSWDGNGGAKRGSICRGARTQRAEFVMVRMPPACVDWQMA